ncbi:MAG TPA: glycosyltransferase family 2 protein [Bacteroidia bacterium]|nr:glycosyltransferase family 2 protein [Bacteroidia bacterium]
MIPLKISIVTPSFNQGAYLEQTICSVLEQGYSNLEYLIIDGGSKDDSVAIIERYANKLAYWVSEPDNGQSHAINKGFQKANGEILMWLNSDDMLLPGSLQKINAFFQAHPQTELMHGKTIVWGAGMKEIIKGHASPDPDACYLGYMCFPQPSSFFRKSLLSKTGLLNENLHYGMDYEMLVKAYLGGADIKYMDDIFSKYRMHPEGKSNNESKIAEDWSRVYSNVLRSLENTALLIKTMDSLGLYRNGIERYDPKRAIPDDVVFKSALYHLMMQAHFAYTALNLKKTNAILKSLKQLDSAFYLKHKLNRLHSKASVLPVSLIRLGRLFTRG